MGESQDIFDHGQLFLHKAGAFLLDVPITGIRSFVSMAAPAAGLATMKIDQDISLDRQPLSREKSVLRSLFPLHRIRSDWRRIERSKAFFESGFRAESR